jgi:osmotically inducible protein OsmC
MAAQRTAEVIWENDLLNGRGRVKFGSGAIPETSVSWAARTESPGGKTSPEELLAGAHASCFSMAFSNALAKNKTPPKRLDVKAVVTFDKVGDGWKVTTSELTVKGEVPGIDQAKFLELANGAKENCPISQAIKNNVAIKLNAQLA